MKYTVKPTKQFRKNYQKAKKRGLPINLLDDVIELLANGETLPPKYKDHSLGGKWSNHRECHIEPDYLLVYHIDNNVLVLTLVNTGTHSDLF